MNLKIRFHNDLKCFWFEFCYATWIRMKNKEISISLIRVHIIKRTDVEPCAEKFRQILSSFFSLVGNLKFFDSSRNRNEKNLEKNLKIMKEKKAGETKIRDKIRLKFPRRHPI